MNAMLLDLKRAFDTLNQKFWLTVLFKLYFKYFGEDRIFEIADG